MVSARVASRGDRVGVCGAGTEGVARCFVAFISWAAAAVGDR